ncbi:hypothetical protein [Microbacterium sp. LWS13-1.2]|uniref:Uncharacterized protein n=1 Tax=Microbacterium sp. LWS13-1.2 TaxID=3135264 RepID=A0AAU6SGV6_9MICO
MADIDSLVPPHEPAEDALATVGKIALSLMIPGAGPILAEVLGHAVATRQAAMQHDFNAAVARELERVAAGVDEALTVEDVIASDEFIASMTRASRVASETSSHAKRRRLAAAVANGGPWAAFPSARRERFTKLVNDYDDLHVWMLQYLNDPEAWLQAHGIPYVGDGLVPPGPDHPLNAAFRVPAEVWQFQVARRVADLDAERLVRIPEALQRTPGDPTWAKVTGVGREFLAFVGEPEPVAVPAPEL